ncbi:MAG: yjeP [Cytophagaceae bacterium]|jgi:small-conductance mechanosensitive channel|nr:yjeP [Cytophagaceae bacterium]
MTRSLNQIVSVVFLALVLSTTAHSSYGQDVSPKDSLSRKERKRDRSRSFTLFSDSASATQAEYMLHLESIFQKIDSIQSESTLSAEVLVYGQQLDESDSVIQFVNKSLVKYDQTLNIRNIEMLKILLEGAQADLRKYNKSFKAAYNNLSKLKDELRSMRKDTLLRQMFRDSTARKAFMPQLKDLRASRRYTDSLLTTKLSTVNGFKSKTSGLAILSSKLMNKLNKQLSSASKKVFAQELHYLWQAPEKPVEKKEGVVAVFLEEQRALNYYYANSTENRFVRWIIGLVFLFWIVRNVRTLKRKDKLETLAQYDIMDIARQPIAASFAVIFTLAPLFDLHAPAAYVQLVQFMSLIALTFLYWKQWTKRVFYFWIAIVVLFFLFTLSNHILVPTFWQRCAMLVLNFSAIAVALLFRKALPEDTQIRGFIRAVLILQILLNALAIFCNITGRMTLSQLLGVTSILAVMQALSLSMFVKIMLEAVVMQIHTSRIRQGIESPFQAAKVISNFRRPLLWLVVVIWFIVFTTNLNIYDTIFDTIADFLATVRSLGSITFTFGSILLFIFIIWLAHFLQRYVSYFLGDTGDEEGEESLAQRSKLVMTRLLVLAIGYLLAVAASGVPVDKITIVLGALGVGIGLGLQNIVNNFVSGVILIFDRPLKVGDSVEVGAHAGRVKEIGLRSSTLVTTDGADVIIPNGDMLSQHITNWTHSNLYKRVELKLTVTTTEDKEHVTAILKEVIKSAEHVLKKREPVVLLETTKENEYLMNVYFWCEDFYKADQTKSEVRYLIYQELKQKGIGLKG